jgi:hypothetical protein
VRVRERSFRVRDIKSSIISPNDDLKWRERERERERAT